MDCRDIANAATPSLTCATPPNPNSSTPERSKTIKSSSQAFSCSLQHKSAWSSFQQALKVPALSSVPVPGDQEHLREHQPCPRRSGTAQGAPALPQEFRTAQGTPALSLEFRTSQGTPALPQGSLSTTAWRELPGVPKKQIFMFCEAVPCKKCQTGQQEHTTILTAVLHYSKNSLQF